MVRNRHAAHPRVDALFDRGPGRTTRTRSPTDSRVLDHRVHRLCDRAWNI